MEVSIEPTTYTRGQSIHTLFEDEDLVYLCILTTAPEGPVDQGSVLAFSEWNGVTHPVLGDIDAELAAHGLFEDTIEVMLNPDMEVVAIGDLPLSEPYLRNQLTKMGLLEE